MSDQINEMMTKDLLEVLAKHKDHDAFAALSALGGVVGVVLHAFKPHERAAVAQAFCETLIEIKINNSPK